MGSSSKSRPFASLWATTKRCRPERSEGPARAVALFLTLSLICGTALQAQSISYETRTLDGAEIRIGPGQQPTLVAVFATWCRVCRSEFPALDSLSAALATKGVRVLALSVDAASDSVVHRFTTARRTKVLVAHDGSGRVSRTFAVTGVPENLLIDRAGIVRWHGRGAIDPRDPKLKAALAALR